MSITMRRVGVMWLLAIASAVLALVAAPAAFAGSTGAVEVEADLTSPATGKRVAVVDGSVGANGRGYASIVPLSGASSVGMVRGEAAQMRRRPDGSLVVVGGLGTRIYLSANERLSKTSGWGRLSLALRARRTTLVAANGVAWSRPYAPKRGQRVIVVGTSTGAVRNALGRRYQLVRYSPATYSRAALMANPARYRSVAGVLLGQDVTAAQMNSLDLPRSFYNSGRWVATSGNPKALDQHMYTVAHAHLGRAGVIIKRATPVPGATANMFMQIREPRIAHVRVGSARVKVPARPKARDMSAMVARSSSHLAQSLAKGEQPVGASANAREQAFSPPTVSNNVGLATMQVTVDQLINVDVDTPSWLYPFASSFAVQGQGQVGGGPYPVQCSTTPLTFGGVAINFVPATGNVCPPEFDHQVMALTYYNVYSISLKSTGAVGTYKQVVSEASALQVNTVANPASTTQGMAAGSYQVGSGLVQPASAGQLQVFTNNKSTCGTLEYIFNGDSCPYTWATVYSQSNFSALGLQNANHSISMQCVATCRNTQGTTSSPVYEQELSSPRTQVLQGTTNIANGSDWSLSQTSSSEWNVGGNLGFFGGTPTGGFNGGYSSGSSTTNTTGGNYSQSTSFTYGNWVTDVSPIGTQPHVVAYATSSANVPGAPPSSPAYPAAQAFSFNRQSLQNQGGFISLPSSYGNYNPGPVCAGASASMQCTAGVAGAFGSQMNATSFEQGSVSSFAMNAANGQDSLAIGTVNPAVADTLYLWEQWINSGSCNCDANNVPDMSGVFTEVQVLDLDTVSAAQSGAVASTPKGSVGSKGLAGGLTTNYGANGQALPAGVAGTYTTLGLDLCAPPVLTSDLWAAGCNKAPGFSGPPATAAGAGPTITGPTPLSVGSNGQLQASTGTKLTCNPGTWSGSPTLSYQWQLWSQEADGWGLIPGATGATFTMPAPTGTAPAAVECTVTAKNTQGTTQASTASVETKPGG